MQEFNEQATREASNGRWRAALRCRESALIQMIKERFKDPSEETDFQKLLIAQLIAQHLGDDLSFPAEYKADSNSLCDELSDQGLVAFAERLISPSNMLEKASKSTATRRTRAQLKLSLANILGHKNRHRAALPWAEAALDELIDVGLEVTGEAHLSADVIFALLATCAFQTSCGKHHEALVSAQQSLKATLALEQHYQENDPLAGGQLHHSHLQAASHFNIGAQQEHLKLLALAEESYKQGYSIAHHGLGVDHPLTEALKKAYAEVSVAEHKRAMTLQRNGPKNGAEAAYRLNAVFNEFAKRDDKYRDQQLQQRAIVARTLTKGYQVPLKGHLAANIRAAAQLPRTTSGSTVVHHHAGRVRPTSAVSHQTTTSRHSSSLYGEKEHGKYERPRSAMRREELLKKCYLY